MRNSIAQTFHVYVIGSKCLQYRVYSIPEILSQEGPLLAFKLADVDDMLEVGNKSAASAISLAASKIQR
jgi:hypothetical protein